MKKKNKSRGVRGRNEARKNKLMNFAFAAIMCIAILAIGSAYNDFMTGVTGGVAIAGGLKASYAGFGLFGMAPLFHRDPNIGGGGGGGAVAETEAEKLLLEKVKNVAKVLIDTELGASKAALLKIENTLTDFANKLGTTEIEKAELQRLAAEVGALKEKGTEQPVRAKSFAAALADAYTEKKEEIDAILKNGGKQNGPLRLEVKAAVTMGMDNTIEAVGSESHFSLTSNTGIISTLRKRILKYLGAVSIGGISVDKPYAMWIEELDEQGDPIFIGEGDDKIQLSVRYEEREKKAKKIAVYGKVTTEMLRYLPQLVSYIQNNLVKRMDIKTEDQLFNGDDTGDNLAGLIPYATAFDGDGLAGTINDANEYDVIRAIALQVTNAYGIPNKIFVHPTIQAKMELLKDSQGRYIMPPFATADGTRIAGVEIIGTNALGEDEFVGGDLSVVNVAFLSQTGITIGLDGNDFTKNKKTILVEQELVQFVSANDTQVIIKGDFTTAKALLELP